MLFWHLWNILTNNFQDFLVDVSYCSRNTEGVSFPPFWKTVNNFPVNVLYLLCLPNIFCQEGKHVNSSCRACHKNLFFPVWLCTLGISAVCGEQSCIFMHWHRQIIILIAFKLFNDIIYLSTNNCNHFGFIIHCSLDFNTACFSFSETRLLKFDLGMKYSERIFTTVLKSNFQN